MLATRVLNEQEYQQWAGDYEQAASNLDDREQRIAAVSEKIERDLELVGVTAIEDKLQAGVPEAINKLITAGIKERCSLHFASQCWCESGLARKAGAAASMAA